MAQTTTKPTTDIDDIELFHPDIDTDDTPQTDTTLGAEPAGSEDSEAAAEALTGPGAAFAAAMDLAVTGAHVHLVASGENDCLTGHCQQGPESVTVLNGVL